MATSAKYLINLFPTVAPRLPAATVEWDHRFMEQYSNVLRLYFNQIDAVFKAILTSDTGGAFLSFPYGAFHQDGVTTLSANISNVSTTPVSVASTDGFPSSGWFLIGGEIISYSGKTSTTFTGITRGVLGTTNLAHTAGAAIAEVQGTGSSTTIGQVLFNNTDYSNGVYTTSADYSKIYFTIEGLYNIQISVQLLNFTTTDDNVTLWFRKNGTDIPASASIEQVNAKHGGDPGASILALNFYIDIAPTDYIQVVWTSNTGNTVVATYPAGVTPTHPVSPAIILTASFVSKLPTT